MEILVVDDQEENRYLLRTMLESEDNSVTLANNGKEALERLREGKYDLIISDILMPVMDGFRFCRACKSLEGIREIPFVFYTATYLDERDEEFALKLGAGRFIRKPVEPEVFLRMIGEVVRDAEAGRIMRSWVEMDEQETYVLYSQRLVRKLEQTVQQLRDEINQRNVAEKELRESEKRYRALFENAAEGILLAEIETKRFREANRAVCEMLGYSRDELIGMSVMDIHPKEALEHVISEFEAQARGEKKLATDIPCLRKDGSVFSADVNTGKLLHEGVGYNLGFFTDVTERKKAEMQIMKSLREKELLIRELFHRTKNNMQVLCALLRLKTLDSSDAEVVDTFTEMENRIKSMALVHEKLYRSKDLSIIDLRDFINDLMEMLVDSYDVNPEDLSLSIEIDPLPISIDIAIPLGLVLNELLANVLKHAFPDGQSGSVSITIRELEGEVVHFHFSDNGIGLPGDFDPGNLRSFGLYSVISIVREQLLGTIEFSNGGGFTCDIRFQRKLRDRRV